MVSVDQLCCLDGLMWLQSGNAVGALTLQHQTTVSRNQRKCAKAFDVDVLKRDGLWQIEGDSQLLQLERGVHQTARLKLVQGLRLEAAFSPETALPQDLARVWNVGSSRIRKPDHFATLLEQRVIEAWLTSGEKAPSLSDAIVSIPLWDEPERMRLVVHRDLHRQPVIQELVTGLSTQHQQQPIRLQSS
jgi:hypothetical protein